MYDGLYQIAYESQYSLARVSSTLETLRNIILISKTNNARMSITGALIFDGHKFLQILEGKQQDVESTYARINADTRHRESRIILSRYVQLRDFSDWSMGGFLQTVPISVNITGEEALEMAKKLMASRRALS
ncbi:BLUF domain-containing protein [Bosea sp. R86505]|uniref:BLUF domain-containing protein n=1 Tax=Bosea sp. R86505 TaxID=3101710 RepID=UPI003670797B